MATLGLVMIVKDEAAVLARCLRSVRPHIDYWTIVDTGSTDDSREVIRAELDGIPGFLTHQPWRNFGENRTNAIALARAKTDWLLFLDADMTLDAVGPFPARPAGMIHYGGALDYAQPLLLSGHHPWHYVGKTHEYLDSVEPFEWEHAREWVVSHHGDGGNRAEKAERDIALLLEDANNGDGRAMFYVAQSYAELGDTERAIEWNRRRVDAGGWIEETYIAQLRVARLTEDEAEYARAIALRPTRAEAFYSYGKLLQSRDDHEAALAVFEQGLAVDYPNDILFVERFVYEWGLLMERGVSAYYCGRPGRLKADMLTLNANLPVDARMQVLTNLEYV